MWKRETTIALRMHLDAPASSISVLRNAVNREENIAMGIRRDVQRALRKVKDPVVRRNYQRTIDYQNAVIAECESLTWQLDAMHERMEEFGIEDVRRVFGCSD